MSFIKNLIPDWLLKFIRPYYHGCVAVMANIYFGRPAGKMIVIGVTGTAGKSTTTIMLARILTGAGKKCGYVTTVGFSNGSQDYINKHGVSMPGGWLLSRQLRQMLDNGCGYAVVECTSEGLAQNRHLGVGFDMALFTNLSQAHVEAHGGFENYKRAKGKLFAALSASAKPQKTIVANLDDPSAYYFLQFKAQRKIGVSFQAADNKQCEKIYQARQTEKGFRLDGLAFEVKLFGDFNRYNALLAAAAANVLGVSLKQCAEALAGFTKIRGRMEPVENNLGLKIFVDYGCEPASFSAALKSAAALPHKKIIHVFGSTGGHRDVGKQSIFGKTSAQFADHIIITNDDIYDSDPNEIAANIESGIMNYELWKGQYEIILDRRAAIRHALFVARAGDVILITGKGSEQFLVLPGNKRIEWDDVGVVKEEIAKLSASSS